MLATDPDAVLAAEKAIHDGGRDELLLAGRELLTELRDGRLVGCVFRGLDQRGVIGFAQDHEALAGRCRKAMCNHGDVPFGR